MTDWETPMLFCVSGDRWALPQVVIHITATFFQKTRMRILTSNYESNGQKERVLFCRNFHFFGGFEFRCTVLQADAAYIKSKVNKKLFRNSVEYWHIYFSIKTARTYHLFSCPPAFEVSGIWFSANFYHKSPKTFMHSICFHKLVIPSRKVVCGLF